MKSRAIVVLIILALLPALASAQTLTGTVTNGTTNKPASGDDVVLLSLMNGMQEAGRTQDGRERQLSASSSMRSGPHLIRVIHQGVTYHRMAPPGTTSVEVQVFDVAKKVAGIQVTADVMRFQAQGNDLGGIRLFAVNNTSNPPRTQMNDQNFEFYLARRRADRPVHGSNRRRPAHQLRPGSTERKESLRLHFSLAPG